MSTVTKKQVAKIEEPQAEVVPATNFESALLDIVKRTDIDPERLEKFLDLHAKMQDRAASVAFFDALAGFQGECPIITKSKKVEFKSVKYQYAPLDEIVEIIRPHLEKWGLSFSFNIKKTDKPDENELIVTVRHRGGHSESTSYFFNAFHDDDRMNKSQRAKSSITYAKRAALENALGVVTSDEDDDAGAISLGAASDAQLQEIKKLIKDTKSDEKKLLEFLKIDSLESLSDAGAQKAIHALRQKGGK